MNAIVVIVIKVSLLQVEDVLLRNRCFRQGVNGFELELVSMKMRFSTACFKTIGIKQDYHHSQSISFSNYTHSPGLTCTIS